MGQPVGDEHGERPPPPASLTRAERAERDPTVYRERRETAEHMRQRPETGRPHARDYMGCLTVQYIGLLFRFFVTGTYGLLFRFQRFQQTPHIQPE